MTGNQAKGRDKIRTSEPGVCSRRSASGVSSSDTRSETSRSTGTLPAATGARGPRVLGRITPA